MIGIWLLMALLSSCGFLGGGQRVDLDQLHIAAQDNQYLLAEIPSWANFSTEGGCRRHRSIRFLHYERLHRSYSLDYPSLVQFQLAFNEQYGKLLEQREGPLPLQLEEQLFFQARNRVAAGVVPFRMPETERIHLLWLDPIEGNPRYRRAVEGILRSERFYQGHPVLVSLCLGREQMDRLARSLAGEDIDFRFISAEIFTPFDQKFQSDWQFQLALDVFLAGKKLVLFTVDRMRPAALKGEMTIQNRMSR